MPDMVVCLWRWDGIWNLVDYYAATDDGNPVMRGHESPPDHMYSAGVPICGRAVTTWGFENGVRLNSIHPPTDIPEWMSASVMEDVGFKMLDGGGKLYYGTAEAARKICEAK